MRTKERIRNELRRILIAIAFLSLCYKNDPDYKKFKKRMMSFRTCLNWILTYDFNRKQIIQRHHNIKNLMNQGLITKIEDYYILTDKAWEIIGLFTKDYFYHYGKSKKYLFKKTKFNWIKYFAGNKKEQLQLQDTFLQEAGFLNKNKKQTKESLKFDEDVFQFLYFILQKSRLEHKWKLKNSLQYKLFLKWRLEYPKSFFKFKNRYIKNLKTQYRIY